MSKYEEALDWLSLSNDCDMDRQAIETLQELVDKATPMKPARKRVCHFKSYSDEYICPNCGYHFVTLNKIDDEVCKKMIINKHKCCNNCGQAIDWSD